MTSSPENSTDRKSKFADRMAVALESAKSVVFLVFSAIGITFLISNWARVTDLLGSVSKFEGFGVKFEINRSYERSIVRSGPVEQGYLTLEQLRAIQVRANWILPVLSTSTILWVDDKPGNVNNEIQLLTAYRVSIRIALSTDEAIKEVISHKFDLVVSDIYRPRERTYPLSKCKVHWFASPKAGVLVSWFNRKHSNKPEAGFYLADILMQKIPDRERPPIIFYHGYTVPFATSCSVTAFVDTYSFINSVFDHLERRRWRELERFDPPWSKVAQPKP